MNNKWGEEKTFPYYGMSTNEYKMMKLQNHYGNQNNNNNNSANNHQEILDIVGEG